jgi:hypothetical protein
MHRERYFMSLFSPNNRNQNRGGRILRVYGNDIKKKSLQKEALTKAIKLF